MGTRSLLQDRLTVEFDDAALAADVVQRLGDGTLAAVSVMCRAEFATSPTLSYRPAAMLSDQVDALIAFSYGYRLTGIADWQNDAVPPIGVLLPGPVNELLAAGIAAFVAHRPVPVMAQWEISRELERLGTSDVVSVEPDVGDDGSTVYLSTAGVLDKGLRLALGESTDWNRPE